MFGRMFGKRDSSKKYEVKNKQGGYFKKTEQRAKNVQSAAKGMYRGMSGLKTKVYRGVRNGIRSIESGFNGSNKQIYKNREKEAKASNRKVNINREALRGLSNNQNMKNKIYKIQQKLRMGLYTHSELVKMSEPSLAERISRMETVSLNNIKNKRDLGVLLKVARNVGHPQTNAIRNKYSGIKTQQSLTEKKITANVASRFMSFKRNDPYTAKGNNYLAKPTKVVSNQTKTKIKEVRDKGIVINYNPKTETFVSGPLSGGMFQGLIKGVGAPPFPNYMVGQYYLHVGLNGELEYGRNKNVVPPELVQRRLNAIRFRE